MMNHSVGFHSLLSWFYNIAYVMVLCLRCRLLASICIVSCEIRLSVNDLVITFGSIHLCIHLSNPQDFRITECMVHIFMYLFMYLFIYPINIQYSLLSFMFNPMF